jgi:excisionase family DNA binding protein
MAAPIQLRLWNDQEISVSTAARILRCSRGTVMYLLERGDLRGYQVTGENGWWRVSYESVADHQEKIRRKYSLNGFMKTAKTA